MKSSTSLHILAKPLALTSVAAAALLAACGGGGDGIGSGGTGAAPTTGQAVGTVDGFGSVFVGGVRCDDTRARVDANAPAGAPESAHPDVRLGQRVRIVFDPTSASCKITNISVDAEVIGVVTSLAPLTVAGQRVTIVTDPTIAPPTVFEGYANGAAIALGDRVELHGEPVTVSGVTSIQASRIERKPAADQWVRARGVIANLSGNQFTLGGLTVRTDGSTQLDPASLVLANGQTVIVWSTAPVAGDGSVIARFVRLARRTMENRQAVRVEGNIAGCTATPCTTPSVDGLRIDFSGATFTNGSAADIANGQAVRVEGAWDEASSVLVATRANVRRRDASAGDITLIGAVSDYVSATDFNVRGVNVTTNGSTTFAAGCTVAPNQIVGIKGRIENSQVLASRVDCLTLADGTTLDIFGGIVNLDAAAKTFNLSEGPYRTYTLTWDDDTLFGAGLTAAALANGQHVGLRAVLVEGKLLVKRIFADVRPAAPAGVQLFGNFGIARDVTPTSLAVNTIQMSIVPGTTTVNGTLVNGAQVRTWFYRTGPAQPWIALQVNRITW